MTGKMSGKSWARKLGMEIVNPVGWPSVKNFKCSKIYFEEFAERASKSVNCFADGRRIGRNTRLIYKV